MKKILSFTIDHNKLERGVYISRVDGDITTFDLRFIKPNTEPFLDSKAAHTIEHLFATFARNSQYSDNVIYFGPMGCLTGFYFLTRDLSVDTALQLIKDTIKQCCDYEGEIPGNSQIECGNYRFHDFEKAKETLREYAKVIENLSVNDMKY